MSTDDLTARARARAEAAKWFEGSATAALVSELADEVDRLRALHADLTARLGYGDGITEPQADNDTIVRGVDQDRMDAHDAWEERDAARAALERVRGVRAQHPVCDVHPEDDSAACGWKRTVIDIDEALEGES